jgi:perosamine synthetase
LCQQDLTNVRAMIASHYFGIAKAMASVKRFCSERGIALIEDCAHAYFGAVDGRPIGSWGDFAIASLPKFFPVLHGGCLASSADRLERVHLSPQPGVAEVRALWDAIEIGARYGRFWGLNASLRVLFAVKNRLRRWGDSPRRDHDQESSAEALARTALGDEALIDARPTRLIRWLVQHTHAERIIANRRRNYALLSKLLSGIPSSKPLMPTLPEHAVPYVFPLRVQDPERKYQALRAAGVPIFRWDVIWPGTPTLPGDQGLHWANEVFQLGCHQDLSEEDIGDIAAIVRRVIETTK